MARLYGPADRLVADVLPLPAGVLEVHKTGEFPRPDHAKVEGLDKETDPIIAAIEKDENLRMGGKS